MNNKITIYHNPRCGKSRTAKNAVESAGLQCDVVEYLQNTLTKSEIKSVLKKLNMRAFQVIRTKEEVFKTHYEGKNLTDDEWIQAIIEHPILLERPIVIHGSKAWIARDPQAVEAALKG